MEIKIITIPFDEEINGFDSEKASQCSVCLR